MTITKRRGCSWAMRRLKKNSERKSKQLESIALLDMI
jgi:hypothetical protein